MVFWFFLKTNGSKTTSKSKTTKKRDKIVTFQFPWTATANAPIINNETNKAEENNSDYLYT